MCTGVRDINLRVSTSLIYILDLRIEWARARSRALRWEEEKRLLPEEMRRTVATHIGTRNRWLSRLNTRSDLSTDISRGVDAYACRQADIYYSLAVSFVDIWSPVLRENGITVNWPPELAERAATVNAVPERKSGRKKAKPAYMSDSESEGGGVDSVQLGGDPLESDTDSLVGGKDANESDGESVLLHFAGYADSENSEEDSS
jgi:hypothetical protein